MRTQSLHASLLSSRESATGFGHAGTRRVSEDESTESLRRFLADRLRGRFAELAALVGCSVGRVYAEVEGRQHLSHAVATHGAAMLRPDETRCAEPTLLPALTPAAGDLVSRAAALITACALAESDGVVSGAEAAELQTIGRHITGHVASIVATAETAAGIHLMGERAPR